jgi:tetratricopeptide (TPR) repeat protein
MKSRAKTIVWVMLVGILVCLGMPDVPHAKDVQDYYQQGLQAYNAARYQDAIQAWKRGLDLAKRYGDERSQGVFLGNIGLLYGFFDQYQKALTYHQEALTIHRKIGDIKGEGGNLLNIGVVYSNLGQYQKALSHYQKALAIKKKIGDVKGEGDNLTAIGVIHDYLGQYQKAFSYHQESLTIFRKIGDIKGEGMALSNIGNVYSSLGQYQKALTYHQESLTISRKIGDVKSEGSSLANIGVIYRNLGQYQKALSHYQKALAIFRKIGDVKGEGGALSNIGNVYSSLGQYQKALTYHQESLTISRKIGDIKGEGMALSNIGNEYSDLGQYQKALSYYQKSLTTSKKIGDVRGEGAVLGNIGLVYDDLGQYQKALLYYQEALVIQRKIGDVNGEGDILNNIGTVYHNLGQYQKALLYYQEALVIQRKIGDIKGEGDILNNMGGVYSSLGQYQKALSYHQKSLAIKRKIGDVKGEGNSLNNISNFYTNLGQYQKALSHYQKALAIYRKIGDVKGEGAVLGNICVVYYGLGQYQKALSYLQESLTISRKIGDVKGEGEALGNIGLVYNNLGQYQKALSHYQKALAIKRKIGDVKGEGNSLRHTGLTYHNLGQYQKALLYYQEALAIHRKIGDVKGEGGDLNNIGYTTLCAGKPVEAETHLESAIVAWESIRSQAKTGRDRAGFQSTLPNVYGSLAAARLAQGDQPGAFDAVERGRAKSFLDLLGSRVPGTRRSQKKTEQIEGIEMQLSGLREKHVKLASVPAGKKTRSARKVVNQQISDLDKQRLELIDQLRRTDPELGALTVVEPPNLKEIQSLLPNGTALVEYFHPGKLSVAGKEQNQLWIFVVHARGLHFKTVDVSKADLEIALEKYAKLVADGSSDPKAVVSAGAKLHKLLLKPIEPVSQLTNANTLVIVPWGPMFKIPFAALSPKGGKPLGTKKNVVMAPSAGVYRYLVKKRASGRKNILAIGNPKTSMVPLPGAEKEAREIAGLFGKSKVYTRGKATEALIKKTYAELGQPDVVHLACHGIFNEKAPQLSHLALTPDQKNDGKLEMHELFDLDWRGVSLVTMSACSSGKGKLGAGDDLVGLTRGFMFAGAPSILCSLWDVDDEATRTLMVDFYKNYLSGMSKPEALRKAQVTIQKSKKWSHPYYWGAFVLFGDWE